MSDWYTIDIDPREIARERKKARELRKTQWWKNLVNKGICHYCGRKVPPSELTMDHVVPVARGGKSTRGNLVPSCKPCNAGKKLKTPAEELLEKERQICRSRCRRS